MTEDLSAFMADLNMLLEEDFSEENINSKIDLSVGYPHLILRTEDLELDEVMFTFTNMINIS